MEDLRLIVFITGFVFLLMKQNLHFSLFYEDKESYPGFITAFRKLPSLKKFEAVMPVPYLGISNNSDVVRKIKIYLILGILFITLSFILPSL